jgi:hypothetical protein
MALLTTAAQVRGIIETEISDTEITSIFIPMTNAFMAQHLADCDEMLDATDTLIRQLLTAHFMSATRDIEAGSLVEFAADTVRVRLGGSLRGGIFGPGLRLTRYGLMAIELDPCGILSELADDKPYAEIEVIKLPLPEDETGN